MKRLIAIAIAALLTLSIAAPVAARDRFWTPEDGRAGVAGPWYSPSSTWLDPLRCDAWQRWTHAVPSSYLLNHLRLHGWPGTLDDYWALTRTEQCAWALSH